MSKNPTHRLVVAISSTALFDLQTSHQVYVEQGLDAYRQYQIEHEDDVLQPGDAFPLVKKLLAINACLDETTRIEVILLSRNSSDTGLRVFNSIEHHQLPISRAAFTGGLSPYRYIKAFGGHLFLSTNSEDVCRALGEGIAAAIILPGKKNTETSEQLRIAFDGDAVLFSDEAERVYQEQGLTAFTEKEKAEAKMPLMGGPFKDFLAALNHIQKNFPQANKLLRTALVTARSAPAHERVVLTLRAWDIRIDESLFLGGMDKSEFLHAFNADIFFDDQENHCRAASVYVASGHVPNGVINAK